MSVQFASWPLQGGIDLVSPSLSVQRGRAILAENYECNVAGRFRRMDGYTLYDGSVSPAVVPGSGPVRGVHEYKGDVYAFRDSADGTSGMMYKSSLTGWEFVMAMQPGGKYEFRNHNFTGHAGREMMYGVNGVNHAFQWDGITFTQLETGMSTDTPNHIGIHKNHLFLTFTNGSLQHSGLGDPTSFSLVTGAGELGMGAEITALRSLQNNVLAVFANGKVAFLYGTSSSDWDLREYKTSSGCVENTVAQVEADLYFYNGDEVASLAATQAFGDYESASLTGLVKPFIAGRSAHVVGAVSHKDKNQYRLFFNDKSVLVTTIVNRQVLGHTTWLLGHTPSFVTETYMGCTDGSVMKMDTGPSFSGNAIQSFLRLPYENLGTPHRKKRFRSLRLQLEMGATTTLNYIVDYSSGVESVVADKTSVTGEGGLWNVATWDDFVWSASAISSAKVPLNSTGENISLFVEHSSAANKGFTLDNLQLAYSMRGVNQ